MSLFAVALGGALGSVCRYLIGVLVVVNGFPVVTLLVNSLGCFGIGVISCFFGAADNALRLFLLVGFFGGFTTFSTFGLEVLQLVEQQRVSSAILYSMLSLFICIVCVYLGLEIGRRFFS